jgi:hypothetical protein
MRKAILLLSVVLVVAAAGSSWAASESDLAKENAELKQRVEKLEGEVEGLKKTVPPGQPGTAESRTRMPVWSSLDVQIYGYLKLDAAYDGSRINNGNFAQWVTPENMNDDDDQFNMTANESRFGVNITGPDSGRMRASGRAEVDFYGGSNENQAHLMMRHAYLKLDWPDDRFSIIAGQTSDVISPLLPSTVNYSVGWWTGNIGYRRPQFRLTKELGVDTDIDMKLEGALARTIGRDNVVLAGVLDSGEDEGFPTVQARASVTMPIYGPDRTTMGVSWHWGKEEYDTTAFGDHEDFTSWSLNFDLTQPVSENVTIQAELFTGDNLDAYLGGIGQGVTTTAGSNQNEEVGSTGGWIAASLGPWDDLRYNVGVGMDDVDRGDVHPGDRTMNRSIFANMFYALSKHVEWALELSHWRTEYRGSGDADSVRIQTALIYKF